MHSDAQSLEPTPKTSYLPYGVIFLAALAALAWQFIFPAYYNYVNYDAVMGPKYILQFEESFRQGLLYPRWMPEDWAGYGSPTFVFYSPVFFLLASVLHLAGLGIPTSITLLDFIGYYIGGVFLFLLLRDEHGDRAALIASVFYMLLPTRILDLYYINTDAGRFGQIFMPMVLFFTRKLLKEPFKRGHLAGLSFSYAALILSHLATAYIFTPFIFVYGLLVFNRKPILKTVLRLCAGLGAGLMLSSFFFIPVLSEGRYVQLHNLRIDKHFWEMLVFNLYPGPFPAYPLMKTAMTAILLEMIFLVIVYYLTHKNLGFRLKRVDMFFFAAVFLCMFMMSSPAHFLWTYLPGLPAVAFPVRFIPLYLLFMSMLLGIIVSKFVEWPGRPWAYTLLFYLPLLCLVLLDVRVVSNPGLAEAGVRGIRGRYNMSEYLPKEADWVSSDLRGDDPLLSSGDEYSAHIIKWGSIDRVFAVDSPRGARIRVKTFYFPGWRGWVDGKETRLWAENRSGAILMDVPPGRHEVNLKFTDAKPRAIGKFVSLLTLAALVLPHRRRRENE